MIPKAYDEFIRKLIEATEDGKVSWEEDLEKTLICRRKNITVSIIYHFDEDAELSYYYFYYHNVSDGKRAQFRVSSNYKDYEVMERLYNAAAANAHGIEEELEDFFD